MLRVEQREFVLRVSTCSDSAGFFSRGNLSWSPYTAVIMNLPPNLRDKFAVNNNAIISCQTKNIISACSCSA
jgi:hypothetical protein